MKYKIVYLFILFNTVFAKILDNGWNHGIATEYGINKGLLEENTNDHPNDLEIGACPNSSIYNNNKYVLTKKYNKNGKDIKIFSLSSKSVAMYHTIYKKHCGKLLKVINTNNNKSMILMVADQYGGCENDKQLDILTNTWNELNGKDVYNLIGNGTTKKEEIENENNSSGSIPIKWKFKNIIYMFIKMFWKQIYNM